MHFMGWSWDNFCQAPRDLIEEIAAVMEEVESEQGHGIA